MELAAAFYVLTILVKFTIAQYIYDPLQYAPQGNALFYPAIIPAQNVRRFVPQTRSKTTKRQNTPKSVINTRQSMQNAPFVSTPKAIQLPSSIYKRWGPKYVIVENNKKHSMMDLPQMKLEKSLKNQIDHNTKIIQYNMDSPPLSLRRNGGEATVMNLMFAPKGTENDNRYKKLVNKRLLKTKAGLARPLSPLPVQDHYKRFTAMHYRKKPISNMYRELIESDENAQPRSTVRQDGGMQNNMNIPNDGGTIASDIVLPKNALSKQDIIMKELMKEKEELVKNYFGNKKTDDEELYEKVTGKSKLLGFVYNAKNNTIEHERSDEPQYETTPKYYQENAPQIFSNNLVSKLTLNPNNIFSPVDEKITLDSQPIRKSTGDPKSMVIKEHITKQLQLEENMKHGEQIPEVNDFKIDKKRPKLELGEDLHGARNWQLAAMDTSTEEIYPMTKSYSKMVTRPENVLAESSARDAVNNKISQTSPQNTPTNKIAPSSQDNKLTSNVQLNTQAKLVPKIKDDFPTEKVNKKIRQDSGDSSLKHAGSRLTPGKPSTPGSKDSAVDETKTSNQLSGKLTSQLTKNMPNKAKEKYAPNLLTENDQQIHESERTGTNPQGNLVNNRLLQQGVLNEDSYSMKPNVGLNTNIPIKKPLLPGSGLLLPKLKHPGYLLSALKNKTIDGNIFAADSLQPSPGSININSLYVYNVKGKDNSIKLGLKHDLEDETGSLSPKVAEIVSKQNAEKYVSPVNEINKAAHLGNVGDNKKKPDKEQTSKPDKEQAGDTTPVSKPNLGNTQNQEAGETMEMQNVNIGNNLKPVNTENIPTLSLPNRNKPGIVARIRLDESNTSSNSSNEHTQSPNIRPGINITPQSSETSSLQNLKFKGKALSKGRFKRPPAQPCKDNECEGDLMKDMKYKFGLMYDQLFLRGSNHMIQVYSTGCRKTNCDNAASSIKFDGMELGAKSDGLNIVVMSYPGYEFLYSKAYATGMDAKESSKMAQFFATLQPPYILMIAAQGDIFTLLSDVALRQLEILLGSPNFLKEPGSSLAFIGFRGEDVMPWQQLNEDLPGHGGSASYAILGSDHEYVTFGGSGLTISEFIKEVRTEEEDDADTRDTSSPRQKYNPIAAEPSLILSPVKESNNILEKSPSLSEDNLKVMPLKIHSQYVQSSEGSMSGHAGQNNPMVEAEGDNEPQALSNEKLKKLGDFYSARAPHQHLVNESRDEAIHSGITEEDKSFEAGLENTDDQALIVTQRNKHLKGSVKDVTHMSEMPTTKTLDKSFETPNPKHLEKGTEDESSGVPNPQAYHPEIVNGEIQGVGLAGNHALQDEPKISTGEKMAKKIGNEPLKTGNEEETFITKEMSRKLKDGEDREKLKDGFSIKGEKLKGVSNRPFEESKVSPSIEAKDESVPSKNKQKEIMEPSQTVADENKDKKPSSSSKGQSPDSDNVQMASEEMPDMSKEKSPLMSKIKPQDKDKNQADDIKNLMEKQKQLLDKEKDINPADAAKDLHPSPENTPEPPPTKISSPAEKDINLEGMAYNEHALHIPNFHDQPTPLVNGLPSLSPSLHHPAIVDDSPHVLPVVNRPNKDAPAFLGNLINTGRLNPLPLPSSEIYSTHPMAMPGPCGEQLYIPQNPGVLSNPCEVLPSGPLLNPLHANGLQAPLQDPNLHHPIHAEPSIPIYDGPHPYMLTANAPLEPPEKSSVEEKPKATKNADSELQSPEFQKKLKEMLAEELTKKLSEMKISPEKREKADINNQSHKKSSATPSKLKSVQKDSPQKTDGEMRYEDANTIKEEFVEGDDGDFDDKEKTTATTNRDSMKEGDESSSSKDNKTIIDNSNNYFDVKVEAKSESADHSDHDIKESSKKLSQGFKNAQSISDTSSTGSSTTSESTEEEGHKYDRSSERAFSKNQDENEIQSKYDRGQGNSMYQNKDSKIQKSEKQQNEKTKEENAKKYTDDDEKSGKYVDFANLNTDLSNNSRNNVKDGNPGNKMESEDQYIDRENKHLEEALHKELKKERPKQVKELRKLVDDQEEFFDPSGTKSTANTVTDTEQKELVKPLQHYQDLADASLVGNDNETLSSACKRYRVLKNGKRVRVKTKKACVERETVSYALCGCKNTLSTPFMPIVDSLD